MIIILVGRFFVYFPGKCSREAGAGHPAYHHPITITTTRLHRNAHVRFALHDDDCVRSHSPRCYTIICCYVFITKPMFGLKDALLHWKGPIAHNSVAIHTFGEHCLYLNIASIVCIWFSRTLQEFSTSPTPPPAPLSAPGHLGSPSPQAKVQPPLARPLPKMLGFSGTGWAGSRTEQGARKGGSR